MTRKETIAGLHLVEDILITHGLATEDVREIMRSARTNIRNDRLADRQDIAERCFGLGTALVIIAIIGFACGIVSDLVGWDSTIIIVILSVLAALAGQALMTASAKLVG